MLNCRTVAASMPSWRSRPLRDDGETGGGNQRGQEQEDVATENIASVPARWPFAPRAADPDQADRPRGGRHESGRWMRRRRRPESVTVSGAPADPGDEGELV